LSFSRLFDSKDCDGATAPTVECVAAIQLISLLPVDDRADNPLEAK
jgi:hypothetical protein